MLYYKKHSLWRLDDLVLALESDTRTLRLFQRKTQYSHHSFRGDLLYGTRAGPLGNSGGIVTW